MSYIGKINANGTTHLVGSTLYGTCAVAAGAAAKTVVCADFDQLVEGVTIHVKFTYGNTVASPTLNVNSTGAKPILGAGDSKEKSWYDNSVVSFTYDGTSWCLNDHTDNTTYTVPTAGTTALAVGTTASGGSAATWSRSDHVHNITAATITGALGDTKVNKATEADSATNATNASNSTTQAITDDSTKIATTAFVHDVVDDAIGDAMGDLASAFTYKGTKASVANLPATGNSTGDVWHVTADGNEYVWNGTSWEPFGPGHAISKTTDTATYVSAFNQGTVPTLGTAISADDITSWNAGTLPTMASENLTATHITEWSAGTVPTLGTAFTIKGVSSFSSGTLPTLGTAISIKGISSFAQGTLPTLTTSSVAVPNVTSVGTLPTLTSSSYTVNSITGVGTLPTLTTSAYTVKGVNAFTANTPATATVSNGVLTITDGTAASLTTSTHSISGVSSFTQGTLPTQGASVTIKGISEFTQGALPTLGTSISFNAVSSFAQGTLPSLVSSSHSVPNVTGVGTLPSLDTTTHTVPNVTGVGTLPSLTKNDVAITQLSSVGTLPSLSYTARTIPNVTSVGTLPTLTRSNVTVVTDVAFATQADA